MEEKEARWQQNPEFQEMDNLLDGMNEAMDLFGQLLKEKRAQLISVKNQLKEQDGRT